MQEPRGDPWYTDEMLPSRLAALSPFLLALIAGACGGSTDETGTSTTGGTGGASGASAGGSAGSSAGAGGAGPAGQAGQAGQAAAGGGQAGAGAGQAGTNAFGGAGQSGSNAFGGAGGNPFGGAAGSAGLAGKAGSSGCTTPFAESCTTIGVVCEGTRPDGCPVTEACDSNDFSKAVVELPPTAGSSCPTEGKQCLYDNHWQIDQSAPTSLATCKGGAWTLTPANVDGFSCAPTFPCSAADGQISCFVSKGAQGAAYDACVCVGGKLTECKPFP